MEKSEIKGYNLSEDYKKLFELIHKGYRVPAWVIYNDEYEEPIYDIVECKLQWGDLWDIGRRGYSYSSFDKTFEGFEMICKSINLRWICTS